MMKGKFSNALYYIFFIGMICFTMNELTIVTLLKLSDSWNTVIGQANSMIKIEAQLTESIVKTKADYFLQKSDLKDFLD